MTLVDANVFMYAAGCDHPFKKRSTAFLENVANGSVEAAIDTEVLQDILHRYRTLGRWAEGQQVYDTARLLFPAAAAITDDVMNRTRVLMDELLGLDGAGRFAHCGGPHTSVGFDL